jgi:rod shape-determining protein MreC
MVWLADGVSMLAFWQQGSTVPTGGGEDATELRQELASLKLELEMTRQELADWRLGEKTDRPGLTQDVAERFLFMAADVIGRQPQPRRQSLLLSRGERHGVRVDLPVVTESGLVGVVRVVRDSTCIVQLVTDPYFAAAVEGEGGAWQAVAMGRGAGEPLRLETHEPVTDIKQGAVIKTSGLGGSLYPRGLPVGELRRGRTNRLGLESLEVEPLADLKTRFVLILLSW